MPISIRTIARPSKDARYAQQTDTPCSSLAEVGVVLRQRRKELGWSQELAADVCGFNQRMVSEIERGSRGVSFDRVALYASRLGVDVILRIRGQK